MPVKDYRELVVWQEGMDLVEAVYRTTRDFLYFLSIANGSLKELETQVLIARRLAYIDRQKESELVDSTTEVGRLIGGLTNALRRKNG